MKGFAPQGQSLLVFKMIRKIFFFVFLSLIFSCTTKVNESDLLAKVYNQTLSKTELMQTIPKSLKGKDSINFVNSFVNKWVEKNVLIHHAENNLTNEQKNFEKEIEEYKSSLLIYTYQKEFINQKLDTVISEKEIENYYESHPNDFSLKENICKVWYAKIPTNAKGINDFKNSFFKDNSKSKNAVENYCNKYAANYFLDDEKWLFFNDLKKEIPFEYYNEDLFLQNSRHIELKVKDFIYFVNIKGFKIKDGKSPLSLETSNIKGIIFNKRKVKLIEQLKKDLINKAIEKDEVKIFENK
jgi:hypothetical protein